MTQLMRYFELGSGIIHPYFVIGERFLTSTGQCGEQKYGLTCRFEDPLATAIGKTCLFFSSSLVTDKRIYTIEYMQTYNLIYECRLRSQ